MLKLCAQLVHGLLRHAPDYSKHNLVIVVRAQRESQHKVAEGNL